MPPIYSIIFILYWLAILIAIFAILLILELLFRKNLSSSARNFDKKLLRIFLTFIVTVMIVKCSSTFSSTEAMQICLNHGCERRATLISFSLLSWELNEEREDYVKSPEFSSYSVKLFKFSPGGAHNWKTRNGAGGGWDGLSDSAYTCSGHWKVKLSARCCSKKMERKISALSRKAPEFFERLIVFIDAREKAQDWRESQEIVQDDDDLLHSIERSYFPFKELNSKLSELESSYSDSTPKTNIEKQVH